MPIYEYACHGCGQEFEALVRDLAGLGYTRVDQVEDAGEF